MRRLALTATVMLAATGLAAEFKGVSMPDTRTIEGKEVKLNGMGLRARTIVFVNVDVYVAGLYLENPSADGQAILDRDEVRRVDMAMLRDLDKKTIADALRQGFEKNSGDKFAQLKPEMEKFSAAIPDLKRGQALSVVYVPGKGTFVEGQGQSYTAPGKDFADALFSVWIGKFPVDENLKKGMLGKK